MYKFLLLFHPGHVREVVDGDALRRDADHFVQCFTERLYRLQRQSVNEVNVDACDSQLPAPIDSLTRDEFALLAVNRVLDVRVEILNPHTYPIEPILT